MLGIELMSLSKMKDQDAYSTSLIHLYLIYFVNVFWTWLDKKDLPIPRFL